MKIFKLIFPTITGTFSKRIYFTPDSIFQQLSDETDHSNIIFFANFFFRNILRKRIVVSAYSNPNFRKFDLVVSLLARPSVRAPIATRVPDRSEPGKPQP